MAAGRIARKKHKAGTKRQRPGAQAAYKKKIRAARRKKHANRTSFGQP